MAHGPWQMNYLKKFAIDHLKIDDMFALFVYMCVYVCNISHISCFTVLNNCIQLCEHSEATELRKIMKKNKVLKHLQLFGEHKRFE